MSHPPIPRSLAGKSPGRPRTSSAGVKVFEPFSDLVCKDKDATWKFIEHMISPEMEIINAKVGGEMPARKSTYDDPWFRTAEADRKRHGEIGLS